MLLTVIDKDSQVQLDIMEIAELLRLDKERMLEFITSGMVEIPNSRREQTQGSVLMPLRHRSGRLRLTHFPEVKSIQYGRVRH